MDSKFCWRLDNFLGPSHQTKMTFWDYVETHEKGEVKSKELIENWCAKSHSMYREKLGAVDQADVKATVMGLTGESDPRWYQNQLKFLIESAISSCHANYNLDKTVRKPEAFTEFHNMLLVELIEQSKDYRVYKASGKRKLSELQVNPETPRARNKTLTPTRHRDVFQFGQPSKSGILCQGRKNPFAYVRKCSTRRQCQFCGKRTTRAFECIACKSVFCMEAPTLLQNPQSDSPRTFRHDGPFCWHLIHGFTTWAECHSYEG